MVPEKESYGSEITHLLSGVLAGASDGDQKKGAVRGYRGVVTSKATIKGDVDVAARAIRYLIGYVPKDVVLARVPTSKLREAQRFVVSETVAMAVAATTKRAGAPAEMWASADFSSLLERLAAGVGVFANQGKLTCSELMGGGQPSLVAIGGMSDRLVAGKGHVYVPSDVGGMLRQSAFAALIAAVSGCGGTLVTDRVLLDPGTNNVRVPTAVGADLALGCIEAIKVLLNNMVLANAGAIGVYAVVRGIHRAVTVRAHSDEGGFCRDVLRAGEFTVPYGPVMSSPPVRELFPQPAATLVSVRAWVDSIALTTAAAAAHSDPGVVVDGEVYPTVLTAVGKDSKGWIEAHGTALTSVVAPFARNYVSLLAHIFGITSLNMGAACDHLMSACSQAAGKKPAHLEHETIAPFFWIEPTCVLPAGVGTSETVRAGYGSLAGPGATSSRPAFAGASNVRERGDVYTVDISWRSARIHGMLQHMRLHPSGDLSKVSVLSAEPSRFCLAGGASGVRDKMVNREGLDRWLWGRGHSGLIAPAECIYTGKAVRLLVRHLDFGSIDDLGATVRRLPSSNECGAEVVFNATMLLSEGVVEYKSVPRDVRRERTAAASALHCLRAGVASVTNMDLTVKFSDCSISEAATLLPAVDTQRSNPTLLKGAGTSETAQGTSMSDGARLAPTVLHDSVKGPRQGPAARSYLVGSERASGLPGKQPADDSCGRVDRREVDTDVHLEECKADGTADAPSVVQQ